MAWWNPMNWVSSWERRKIRPVNWTTQNRRTTLKKTLKKKKTLLEEKIPDISNLKSLVNAGVNMSKPINRSKIKQLKNGGKLNGWINNGIMTNTQRFAIGGRSVKGTNIYLYKKLQNLFRQIQRQSEEGSIKNKIRTYKSKIQEEIEELEKKLKEINEKEARVPKKRPFLRIEKRRKENNNFMEN